jgi:hypothetical protein
MGSQRTRRQFVAWIACLAVLAAALMPGLSQALAATHGMQQQYAATAPSHHAHENEGDQEDQDCTEHADAGADADAMPASPIRHAPAHGLHAAHCPFCLLHADTLAPPPWVAGFIPLQTPARRAPPAFLNAPRPLHAWLPAQARAPPISI